MYTARRIQAHQANQQFHRNVEIRYTPRELTYGHFSWANVAHIVRELCRDQRLNPPGIISTYGSISKQLNYLQLNEAVQTLMSQATPIDRGI